MKLSKTWIVTGGLGFIGSHFIELLLDKGDSVICIDKRTYAANDPEIFVGHENYTNFKLWERDINEIEHLPEADYLVNFAAESHVDNSFISPRIFVRSNVNGVQNLLELVRAKPDYKRPLFIQISTDEVFGESFEDSPASHKDRLEPRNPYSATKAAAEHLVTSYMETFNIASKIIRMTNNYGTRQFPEKLIPAVIKRIMEGKPIIVHGDGNQKREWLHVKDACQWIYNFSINDELTTFHIGAGEHNLRSVNDVVFHIQEVMKRHGYNSTVKHVDDRYSQDKCYHLEPDNETKVRVFQEDIEEIYLSMSR